MPGGGEAQGSPADFPGWECAWQHSPPHGAGARKEWPYSAWLRPGTELAGFCANTKTGDGGDCAQGESGSWRMGPNLRTERDCARKCARKCPRCAPLSPSLPARPTAHARMPPLPAAPSTALMSLEIACLAPRGRCNYVSVSLKDSDCSWYAKCDVSRLEFLSFTGHRTVAVKR